MAYIKINGDNSVDIAEFVRPGITAEELTSAGLQEYVGTLYNYNLWDAVNSVVIEDFAKVLTDLKAAKLQEIEFAYYTASTADIAYNANVFYADESDRALLSQVLSVGSVPTPFYWGDVNSVNVLMTYADLQGLAGTILGRGQAAFAQLQTHRAAIVDAVSVADINAILWT